VLLLRFIRGGLTRLPGNRDRSRIQLQRCAPTATATIRHNDCGYDGCAARGTLLVIVDPRQRILASFLLRGDSPVNRNQKTTADNFLLTQVAALVCMRVIHDCCKVNRELVTQMHTIGQLLYIQRKNKRYVTHSYIPIY
jgi:hydroxyacyl-ACP dehydratase HTD2-like protein with hotdog domain